jgi:uncharacterized protein (TIGR02118 family)
MFKFMILFYHPDSSDRFENSYNDLLALVERMPSIKRRQVISVLGSPMGESPYYRILEVYFEDRQVMEDALLSPAGQEAGGQLMTFPQGSFETIFADVYEEEGGHTPASSAGAENHADT